MINKVSQRATRLIREGAILRKMLTISKSANSPQNARQDAEVAGFIASFRSFVMSLYESDHPFYRAMHLSRNPNPYDSRSYDISQIENCLVLLKKIKEENDSGWLGQSIDGLVSAEIFSDFLEMADHLLERNYKDAAAVITGSTLEEHLRKLCNKHGIETERQQNDHHIPKKADSLNSDLAREGVINKLDQKSVTAWLGLRNHAAHGEYEKYTKEQVEEMLQGVRNFVTRNHL